MGSEITLYHMAHILCCHRLFIFQRFSHMARIQTPSVGKGCDGGIGCEWKVWVVWVGVWGGAPKIGSLKPRFFQGSTINTPWLPTPFAMPTLHCSNMSISY